MVRPVYARERNAWSQWLYQISSLLLLLFRLTTFVNRLNSNEKVYATANAFLHNKPVRKLSQQYDDRKVKLQQQIILAPDSDPMKCATFDPSTFVSLRSATRRAGRPRKDWTAEALALMWARIGDNLLPNLRNVQMDLSKEEHRRILIESASKCLKQY